MRKVQRFGFRCSIRPVVGKPPRCTNSSALRLTGHPSGHLDVTFHPTGCLTPRDPSPKSRCSDVNLSIWGGMFPCICHKFPVRQLLLLFCLCFFFSRLARQAAQRGWRRKTPENTPRGPQAAVDRQVDFHQRNDPAEDLQRWGSMMFTLGKQDSYQAEPSPSGEQKPSILRETYPVGLAMPAMPCNQAVFIRAILAPS